MTEPFDWDDLTDLVITARRPNAAAYLRTRIEAAFVPVERCNHFAALAEARYHAGREATVRAEAAEAENARLREALQYCAEAPLSGWTIAQGYARQLLTMPVLARGTLGDSDGDDGA